MNKDDNHPDHTNLIDKQSPNEIKDPDTKANASIDSYQVVLEGEKKGIVIMIIKRMIIFLDEVLKDNAFSQKKEYVMPK